VQFSDNGVDLIKGGFDFAVRTGDLPDSGLIRRVLMKTPMVTVASPGYLAKRGLPQIPDDLRKHNCITGRRFGAEWRFRSDDGEFELSIDGNLRLDSGDAVREAAVCGLGIAHSTLWLFRKDIEVGSLVTVLDDFQLDGVPINSLSCETPSTDFLVEVSGGTNEKTRNLGNENAGSSTRASKPHVRTRARAPNGAAAGSLQTAVRPSRKGRRPS